MMGWASTLLGWILASLVNTLLNLVDAATYGGLIFPVQAPLFVGYGFLGVSMYLLCTTASQLVVSLFSSFRRGATACATVENIPFYHSISFAVANRVIDPKSMISTILAAYASIAITTGVIFLTLAMLNLDRLVHKFPRVVLVGSMGGIGVFLVQVGLEMATQESFGLSKVGRLFASWVTLGLWLPAMIAATASLVAELQYGIPFVTSMASGGLVIVFYLIALVAPYSLDQLRGLGWLLNGPKIDSDGPFEVYKIFSFALIDWGALLKVLPIVLGAALFGSMHVPINVPSFARLTNQTFSMKRELLTQSISNWISSMVSFVPAYFVYTNSLLFYRAGGRHRVAGILLAISTGCVLWRGLQILNFIPTLIALYLLFYLGVSLFWEALTSYNLCSLQEYWIVWSTIIAMSVTGFLPGILVGALLATIYSFYYVKIHPVERGFSPEARIIKSPAEEWLMSRMKEHCLVVAFEGPIYFANSVEELLGLTFTALDCTTVLVDFSRVTFVDLNAREALLATLTSGVLSDLRVVCLGVTDEKLRLGINQYAHITVSDEGIQTWYHRMATERLGEKPTLEDETGEEVRLLIASEDKRSPPLALDDGLLKEYDRLQGTQALLMALLHDRSQQLVVHNGALLVVATAATDGIFILDKGKIKQGLKHYLDGAWIGLEEYSRGEVVWLDQALALAESTGTFIPRDALDSLPADAQETLLQLSRVLPM